MEPQPALNLIPTIQQAIGNLLTTHEPEFLAFGSRLFMALATIVLSWQGIRMMFSSDALNDKLFDFANLKPSAPGEMEAGEPLFAEA